ncbi:MAG: type IX secretion system sortase PorU [Rhodothermia bacterium]|nr:MAG: type IX secretion system sortase PorU [Rhodothermia bacterium]
MVLLVMCLAVVSSVSAQVIRSRVISDDGQSALVDFEFDWRSSLQEAVDSSGINAWDQQTLMKFSAGFDKTSLVLKVGSYALPQVSVVTREYDEQTVLISERAKITKRRSPEAEAVGLGTLRKEPVVSLLARLYQLDESAGVLRRYRKLRVSVRRQVAVPARFVAPRSGNSHLQVDESALADGTLFKIRITEEGIFRIDRGVLTGLGLSPDSIDPNDIKILGNGGAPVPASNGVFRYADLVENAVFSSGGGDGRFDEGDEILFYAAGPRGWVYAGGEWVHYVHPFSNDNAYFLKISPGIGSRLTPQPFPGLSGTSVRTSTTGRYVEDIEEFLWSRDHGSGYDWMSNTIRAGGSRTILDDLRLPGLLAGTVRYRARAAIASNPRATVAFQSNGTSLAQLTAPRIIVDRAEFPSASPGTISFSESVTAGQTLNLSMTLLNQVSEPQAAVDWVRLTYNQDLVATDDLLRFATEPDLSGPQTYQLRGFSVEPMVWDVSSPSSNAWMGISSVGGGYEFQIDAPSEAGPREMIAFTAASATTLLIENISTVSNQDLHGFAGFPDLVIVTPEVFIDSANRLATHRRQDGLDVQVVLIDQIYNEFSGGVPDMRAIRDYFKFLYDRAPDEASLLQYALLFGDGHYDFRNLSGVENPENNWIFPFESAESLNTDASYTSDDYFGLLDDDEGVWAYSTFSAVSSERVDIGIGRLPAQNRAEADLLVDKIIQYESPESLGAWRSRYVAVADDGPTGLAGIQDDADLHLQNIDQVVELIRGGLYPEIDIDKIYGESFDRVFQNGFKLPGATKEVNAVLNAGTLVFNYSGHGGPEGLAQEDIFTKEHAEQLTNGNRLPLFITATCSWGWWDLNNGTSGAEALLMNDSGGAIALFTTVRLVYTSGDTTSLNAGLNRALNLELFRADVEGKPRRLGDVLRLTKNTTVGLQGNSRKMGLLGDPSMRFGLPTGDIQVESLNSIPLETNTGQLKALDLVQISGRVNYPDGSLNTTFNGAAKVTVFDAVRNVPLVKQVRMPTPYYQIREDLIWRGDVEVQSGQFTAQFVVPKDISYSNEPGRVTVYAASADVDALGYSENFLVGGTSDKPPNDDVGPEIELFLNDTTFVSGGLVPVSPEVIVRLFDQSGVNTVGAGVGHEMLLVLDGDESAAQDISSGFVSDKNSYQRGEARWPLGPISPGPHSLTVRVWDVLNNSSSADLLFSVSDDEVLRITNVYNYPNPMNRETRFVFDHNQPTGTPAQVQIRIYTLKGRPIRTIDTEEALPEGVLTGSSVQIQWNGRDEDFDRLATGIYLYKLRVEVEQPDGSVKVSERIEKLAVIR